MSLDSNSLTIPNTNSKPKPNLMEKVEVMTIMDIIFHPKVFVPEK